MRTILAIALYGLSTSISWGGTASIPPARFDVPFPGHLVVTVDSESRFRCRKMGVDAEACSWLSTGRLRPGELRVGTCHVILPSGLSKLEKYSIVRHEVGHCNGWSEEHEQ